MAKATFPPTARYVNMTQLYATGAHNMPDEDRVKVCALPPSLPPFLPSSLLLFILLHLILILILTLLILILTFILLVLTSLPISLIPSLPRS